MTNSCLSLSHHPLLGSIRPLSRGKAANAIKSNVRKTIALNDMFVARSSPPSPLSPSQPTLRPVPAALYTRLPAQLYSLHMYTYACVRAFTKEGLLHALTDSAVNVCKLASPISHARRLPVGYDGAMGHMENL